MASLNRFIHDMHVLYFILTSTELIIAFVFEFILAMISSHRGKNRLFFYEVLNGFLKKFIQMFFGETLKACIRIACEL